MEAAPDDDDDEPDEADGGLHLTRHVQDRIQC